MSNNKELLAAVTQQNIQHTGDAPAPAKKKTLEVLFESRKFQFAQALNGSGIAPERFLRILITKIAQSEQLTRILSENPASVIGACMEMAQLGLDPSVPNEVSLIPYGRTATSQMGYKGLAKLATQSAVDCGAPLVLLRTECIHANDIYEREMGDTPRLRHLPPKFGEERGEVIGYYAISKDQSGRINFREMTVADVQKHKKRFSKALRGPFVDPENFDAYGMKTVLRQLINKDLPMGSKLARAVAIENAISMGEDVPDVEILPEAPKAIEQQSTGNDFELTDEDIQKL